MTLQLLLMPKKHLGDQKRKDELYMERKRKGIKFYDSKGSGYMKGGKNMTK